MTRATQPHPHTDPELDELDEEHLAEREPIDVRELLRLHPRLLLAAAIVAVLMIPVGIFLAAVGIAVLELSGGAARDTSIIVGMAGFLVADFWGGGIVAALTRARAPQVAIAWGLVRLLVLGLFAVLASRLAPIIPIQLVLSIPAAWAGARVARKQAALRRQIKSERDTRDANVQR